MNNIVIKSRKSRKINFGFTLLELIIAIIILTILGSVIIALLPNLTDSSRQASTVSNLRTIASALSIYRADHNAYPTASNISELAAIIEPKYIYKVAQKDGWGMSFYTESIGSTYTIGSGGKGWNGVEPLTSSPEGPSYTFESDIIVKDGVFTQFPAHAN